MSPAKAARKSNALTIHFSGICTFVWDRKQGTAEVRMVDLASAGFQQHYAALGIAVTEDTPRAITAPDADAAVSLASMNTDMGLWNLIGTDVKIVGGDEFLVLLTATDAPRLIGYAERRILTDGRRGLALREQGGDAVEAALR